MTENPMNSYGFWDCNMFSSHGMFEVLPGLIKQLFRNFTKLPLKCILFYFSFYLMGRIIGTDLFFFILEDIDLSFPWCANMQSCRCVGDCVRIGSVAPGRFAILTPGRVGLGHLPQNTSRGPTENHVKPLFTKPLVISAQPRSKTSASGQGLDFAYKNSYKNVSGPRSE